MAIPAEGAGPARNGVIAYSGVVTENALAEIYAFPLSGGPRVNLSRDPGADTSPAVSPDGTRIIFQSSRRGWVVARTDTFGRRSLAAGGTEWAPDSRHVAGTASADNQTVVVVVDTQTAVMQRVGPGRRPQWSPRGLTVAYIGSDGLFVSSLDSASVQVASARVEEFAWSPEGTRIAYTSGSGALLVVDLVTRETAEIAQSVSQGVRWAPDGTRVYFRGGSVSATGGAVQRFGPVSELELAPSGARLALVREGVVLVATAEGAVVRGLGEGRSIRWSPGGGELAFVRVDGRLLVADVATGAVRVLADGKVDIVHRVPDHLPGPPVWLPDGSGVIAASIAGRTETDLFLVHDDGTGVRRLPRRGVNEDDPAWSPDGRSLAFTSFGSTPTIMVGDDRLRRVRTIARDATEPVWSPDGSRIVYVSTARPHNGIWPSIGNGLVVVGADGRGRKRVTRNRDWSPAWSPDGKTLAFARSGRRGSGLYLLDLRTGHTRRIFAAGAVGQNGEPGDVDSVAWSPAGDRLVFRLTSFVPERFYVPPEEDEVLVVDLRGRVVSRLGAAGDVTWSPDGRLFLSDDGDYADSGSLPGYDLSFDIFRTDRRGHALELRQPGSSPSWQPLCSRSGSERADAIRGGPGADLICGLGGADVLTGGGGRDRLFGGGGNDRIEAGDGAFDIIGCGVGRDTVLADANDLVGADCERVTRRTSQRNR